MVAATENSTRGISSRWEPKRPRQCGYCGRRDGRNCTEKNSALAPQLTGSQFLTPSSSYHARSPAYSTTPPTLLSPILKVTSTNLDLPTLKLEPPNPTSPIGSGGTEPASEKRATRISLRNSTFWTLINITEMVADSNCRFCAAAHIIHGRGSEWPEVRQHLLNHLTANLHDTFAVFPTLLVPRYLCRVRRRALCTFLGLFGIVASGLTAISMLS